MLFLVSYHYDKSVSPNSRPIGQGQEGLAQASQIQAGQGQNKASKGMD